MPTIASISIRAPKRLQRNHESRHVRALNRSDAIASAVDGVVSKMWRDLLASINQPDAVAQSRAIVSGLNQAIRDAIGKRLMVLSKTVHDDIRKELLGSLDYRRQVTEDVTDDPQIWMDLLKRFFPEAGNALPSDPATLPLVLSSESRLDELFKQYILPPIPGPEVLKIILSPTDGVTWVDRISQITRLANPETVAAMVLHSVASGETRVELARRLRPMVSGVKSSAMRVARTEGLRVANEAAWQAHEQLSPMIEGYELTGVKDANSRHWHLARHGTIYYRDPINGQKGFDSLPHPPFEPANMDGVPAGEPRLAQNCRCFLVPVFKPIKRSSDQATEQLIRRVGNRFVSTLRNA